MSHFTSLFIVTQELSRDSVKELNDSLQAKQYTDTLFEASIYS